MISNNTYSIRWKIMFNTSDKQKIIKYFNKVYLWQFTEKNNINFHLSDFNYRYE